VRFAYVSPIAIETCLLCCVLACGPEILKEKETRFVIQAADFLYFGLLHKITRPQDSSAEENL